MSTADNDPPAALAFAGRHRLPPISLPLHEAIGLCLLFQAAPAELVQGLQTDDAVYGFSAAYGYLRLSEAIAQLFGDENSINEIVAERAMLDQLEEQVS